VEQIPAAYGRGSSEARAHRDRCESLSPMQAGEAERLIAAFLATNQITACPARYALPVEQRPNFGSKI
jgi:hypothetical protein